MDHSAVQPLRTTSPSKRNQGNPNIRSPLPISPPPLKRRRINASHLASDESNTLGSLKPLGTGSVNLTLPVRTTSVALPIKSSSRQHAQGGDDLSFADSTQSFGSNQSKKSSHRCKSCSKLIIKAFEPTVHCPNCNRTYHDFCRRRVWTKEQPEIERCARCVPIRQKSRLVKHSSSLSETNFPTPGIFSDRTTRASSANGSLKSAPLKSSTLKVPGDNPASAAPVRSEEQTAPIEPIDCKQRGSSVGPIHSEEQGGPDAPVRSKENGESHVSAHPGEQTTLNGSASPKKRECFREKLLPAQPKTSQAVPVVIPTKSASSIAPVASIDHNRMSVVNKPKATAVSYKEEESQREMRGILMPFEDARDYLALHPQPLAPNVRRSSNFYEVFPRYTTNSIRTMTTAEKEAKIAAIKKRPSRKSYFGDRLHPSRRLQHDPHDESGGMPMPDPEDEPDASKREKPMKKTFNLPENPIPMVHDGQLAFRDGTLVNGKLPRSRVVYKVGRLLGGELRL